MKKAAVILPFMLFFVFILSCSSPKTNSTYLMEKNGNGALNLQQKNTGEVNAKDIDDKMIIIPNINTNYVKLDDINPGSVDEIHLGLNLDFFNAKVVETKDGFLCGYTPEAETSGGSKTPQTIPRIKKLDRYGRLLWEKDYGYKTYSGRINNICAYDDGSFIFSVQTYPYHQDSRTIYEKSFIIKCDEDGNELWKAEFDDYYGGLLQYLFITENGGIIAVGQGRIKDGKVQEIDGPNDIAITKLDKDGSIILRKSFGGSDFDSLSTARYDNKAGILINGITQSHDSEFASDSNRLRADFISCIDENLNVKWVYFAQDNENFIYDQLEADNGFVYVLGSTMGTGGLPSGFLAKLDKNGTRVWVKKNIYSGMWGYAMSVLNNGDIAIGLGQQNQGMVVIFDKDGNELKRYEDLKMAPKNIIPTIDGGFALTSIRIIKTVPQPIYISSIWYDTETVAAKYGSNYALEWRKTYDEYKDVKDMDFVVPNRDGSVLVK